MRQNIAFQIHSDEAEQQKIEAAFDFEILSRRRSSLKTIAQHFPGIYDDYKNYRPQKRTVFVNCERQINVVNWSTGMTLYGLFPEQEQRQDVDDFRQYAVEIDMTKGRCSPPQDLLTHHDIAYGSAREPHPLPEAVPVLVVFGLGLGTGVETLLEHHDIQHLVIYEPDADLFAASLVCARWAKIMNLANQKGTRVYLQLGDSHDDFAADISGLLESIGTTRFFLYRHLHYTVLDAWFDYLTDPNFSMTAFRSGAVKLKNFSEIQHWVPTFMPSVHLTWKAGNASLEMVESQRQRYRENADALSESYSDLINALDSYESVDWQLLVGPDGQVNIYHKQRQCTWFSLDPSADVEATLAQFHQMAGHNDPVLASSGGILKDYIHFRRGKELAEIRQRFKSMRETVPDHMPAMVMFSPALGLQLDKLLNRYEVQSLYYVEPVLDFFYLSMFAADWKYVYETIRERKHYLFLHVGDNGEHLSDDMIARINNNAGHLAVNTYFHVPVMTPFLHQPVRKLLDDMNSVLSLSEYYDHARFAVSHTRKNFRNGVKLLDLNRVNQLPEGLDQPVFVVGNGPSLDDEIEFIKSVRDQVLLISCGTTLKALWRNGIQPDFHAEVEQHKNSYNIVSSLNDPDYLKGITLLGCSWIYPPSAALFKNTLTLFKYGEGMTQVFSKIAAENQWPLPVVKRSYPTVANMVIGFCQAMGVKEVYLFGIDLGFLDIEHHHSKDSIFYNNKKGDKLVDVKDMGWTAIPVPGNFQPMVSTKFDFHLAIRSMEASLAAHPSMTVYNCSNGARIEGTTPLRSDLVLLSTPVEQVRKNRDLIENHLFSADCARRFIDYFDQHTMPKDVSGMFDDFFELFEVELNSQQDVLDMMQRQKQFLMDCYFAERTLIYGLFVASVNYSHAVLIRFLYCGSNWEESQEPFFEALAKVKEYLNECAEDFCNDPDRIDDTDWDLLRDL
ncbi:hypothetical protein C9975_03555 [Thalassospira xiamenensis]|nr:hypothetical protein C9975_03555 [Thalassospira xiamenensis]